jgi:hypothetical protein
MLVLLATILPLTFGRNRDGGTSFLRISDSGLFKLLLVAALCIPIFAVLPQVTGMDHRGQIANWLAAASLTIAALMALRIVANRAAPHPGAFWMIAGACIVGSACAVSIPYDALIVLDGTALNLRLLVLGLVAMVVCGLWLVAWRPAGPDVGLATLAIAIWALLAPAMATGATAVLLLTQGLAVAVAAGMLLCITRQSAAEVAAPGSRGSA